MSCWWEGKNVLFILINFPIEGNTTIYSFLACFDNEREIHIELKDKNQVENEPPQIYTEYEQTKNIFRINLGMLVSHFLIS